MYYSIIAALAILILCIENYSLRFRRGAGEAAARRVYRRFLYAVLGYYLTDVLWGVFESQKLVVPLFVDTLLYFAAMALSLLLWTKYVVTYLKEDSSYGRNLIWIGRIFCGAVLALTVCNVFTPVLFSVDDNCVYTPGQLRYVILAMQVLLLVQISGVALYNAQEHKDALHRRYRSISLFGFVMAGFLTAQLWFPYLPLYTMGYMVGTCLLHSFVILGENEEFRAQISEALTREKQQLSELRVARKLAYRDALTGVQSKLAYAEAEAERDRRISDGTTPPFAVAIFDVNDLKQINDRLGHQAGDQYIRDACREICTRFKHSPVFRIGGDEFAALLETEDYRRRHELREEFDRNMRARRSAGQATVAMGMSDFRPDEDECLRDVFVRADRQMYERKGALKAAEQAQQGESL